MKPEEYKDRTKILPKEQLKFEEALTATNMLYMLSEDGYTTMELYHKRNEWRNELKQSESMRSFQDMQNHMRYDVERFSGDGYCLELRSSSRQNIYTVDEYMPGHYINSASKMIQYQENIAKDFYQQNEIIFKAFGKGNPAKRKLKSQYDKLCRKMNNANKALDDAREVWEESKSGKFHAHVNALIELMSDLHNTVEADLSEHLTSFKNKEVFHGDCNVVDVYMHEESKALSRVELYLHKDLSQYTEFKFFSEDKDCDTYITDCVALIEAEVKNYNSFVTEYREELTFSKLTG